jgi:transposase
VKAYPVEFREQVLADCDAGMNTLAVAVKHDVSPAWVRRLKQRRRQSGEIAPRPPIKKTPPKWHAYAGRMQAFLKEQPDITLRELRDRLEVEVSLQTLSVALRRLKYTLKKKSSARASRTVRTSR